MNIKQEIQAEINSVIKSIPYAWKQGRTPKKAIARLESLGILHYLPARMQVAGEKYGTTIQEIIRAATDRGGQYAGTAYGPDGATDGTTAGKTKPSTLWLLLNPVQGCDQPPAKVMNKDSGQNVHEENELTEDDVFAAYLADIADDENNPDPQGELMTKEEKVIILKGRELLKRYKLVFGTRSNFTPSPLKNVLIDKVMSAGYIAGGEAYRRVGLAEKKSDAQRLNLYLAAGDMDNIETLMEQLTAKGIDLTDQRGQTSISALFRHLVEKALAE